MVSSVNPQIEERQSTSFVQRYKFTLLSLLIIVIALIPLIILSKGYHATPTAKTVAIQIPTSTPTPVPLTQQNAQPTIAATNQSIQNALDQSSQDLNQVNQIDTSQDSVAGL